MNDWVEASCISRSLPTLVQYPAINIHDLALQDSEEHAAAIASYVIEDIIDEDAQSIEQLVGIPLQLSTGSVHVVGRGSNHVYVLTEDEHFLLASEKDLLIRTAHLSLEAHARYKPRNAFAVHADSCNAELAASLPQWFSNMKWHCQLAACRL